MDTDLNRTSPAAGTEQGTPPVPGIGSEKQALSGEAAAQAGTASQPVQETAEQHPRRRRRPARTEEEAGPEAKAEPETGKEPNQVQSGIPEEFYPLERCCICSHPLDTGCAILFTDSHGMARIDENCCTMLEAAARSTDKAEVARAFDYFAAWVPYVKPPVADYLRNYLRVVQTFLNA